MDIFLLAGYYFVGLLENKGDRLEGAGNWRFQERRLETLLFLGHVVQL